jgi:hypothetical protein
LEEVDCNLAASQTNQTPQNDKENAAHIDDNADSIFELYREEIKKQKQASELVQYMEVTIEEDSSNEEAPKIEDNPLQKMWLSLFGLVTYNETKPQRCLLKSWNSSYKHPVEASDSSSKKLVPQDLPRQQNMIERNGKLLHLGQTTTLWQNSSFKSHRPPKKAAI